jgi:hypothetical protein
MRTLNSQVDVAKFNEGVYFDCQPIRQVSVDFQRVTLLFLGWYPAQQFAASVATPDLLDQTLGHAIRVGFHVLH